MSAGDEPEPIILLGGDQIEHGVKWVQFGLSPLEATYLALRVQMGFELWRQLYQGHFVDPNTPDRHEPLRPKPRLDANARVSQYPLVPVDYIIPKSRDERRRS